MNKELPKDLTKNVWTEKAKEEASRVVMDALSGGLTYKHEKLKSDEDILRECLRLLPCGYIPYHTKDKIPRMIQDLLEEIKPQWTYHDIILDLLIGIEDWYNRGNPLPDEIKKPYLEATRFLYGEKDYKTESQKLK